jgi:hypothetical protein
MSEQLQLRRGTAAQIAAFTGAQGEAIVDTTNNRLVVQDGATAGGFPAAKLSEVVTNTRAPVNDAAYSVQTTDRTVAFTALTAARVVSLPAASSFPTGVRLIIVDESGACSTTNTITVTRAGTDLINGATTSVVSTAYGFVAIESNGYNKWTIVDSASAAGGVSTINTLSGAISIVATGGDLISASGTMLTIGGAGGLINRFRNGTMDVWQRGTSLSPPPVAININTATSSSGATATMSLTVPAGALIVVLVTENAGTIGTMADATNGSYAAATSASFNSAADVGGVFYFANSTALSSVTLTYTKHTSGSSVAMSAFYVTGMATSSVLDAAVTASATGSSTSPSVTGGTPGALNELIVGAAFCTGAPAYTQASGFATPPNSISISTTLTGAGGNQFVTGAGATTFAPTLGASQPWLAVVVGFKTPGIPTTGAYTADGWIVTPSGTPCSIARASNNRSGANTLYGLQLNGATSVTDIQLAQRIESYIAAALAGKTVTVQAQVYNNTGGSITPTLTTKYAGSQDNWGSSTTDLSATNLQACANGAWTQVSYTLPVSASAAKGYEAIFDFGNNFGSTSDYVIVTELDIRVTAGVATGLNSNPPPPELRPIATELAFCQRYFWVASWNVFVYGVATAGSQWATNSVAFPTQMRAAPTMTSNFNGTGNGSVSAGNIGVGGFQALIQSTASGAFNTNYSVGNTASAEL